MTVKRLHYQGILRANPLHLGLSHIAQSDHNNRRAISLDSDISHLATHNIRLRTVSP
jgi:hypothetical protein